MKNRPILVMIAGALLVSGGLACLRYGAVQIACQSCDEPEIPVAVEAITDEPEPDEEETEEVGSDEEPAAAVTE